MEATKKVGMISKRILLVSAIVLFAGSITAINIDNVNPLEKQSGLGYVILMFCALCLIYLTGKSLNTTIFKHVNHPLAKKRVHNHYKKIIKKTA